MDLKEAKNDFKAILKRLCEDDKDAFLCWIKNQYLSTEKIKTKEDVILEKISNQLKQRFPMGSQIVNETYVNNLTKSRSLERPDRIVVDAFFYDDLELDALQKEGIVPQFYCSECLSNKTVKPMKIITHSVSKEIIYEIIHYYLKPKYFTQKTVLDIGSRFGGFLYGVHLWTKASRIIGIEKNLELCQVQEDVIKEYNFDDRIEIINKDVKDCKDILNQSDIVFMHNPFEFFEKRSELTKIFKLLKNSFKSKTLLITIPSIQEITKNEFEDEEYDEWVINLYQTEPVEDDDDDCEVRVYFYEVI